ncbi:D-sedoheptulose-7-phosphate isomerase [Raineyella fluvialis]|uniref:SIS domain-containing protein n=1 Tax=Raineyella fluvialis TaxID=2662261 RepID=A0A5Q2FCR3_9ACTN|nr:SIS domain-containing protein [Raineyella fluvialis]QGF24589.1 SIS domain-containing protein [Raineyella fluvialis]
MTAYLRAVPSLTPVGPDVAHLVRAHLDEVPHSLDSLRGSAERLAHWGAVLSDRLLDGHRLLAAGNGGSAAEAQHLTAELVGRFDGERESFAAISLHAETSTLTAISNDYGYDEVFARQVQGHGRRGDILMLFSTSGQSRNLLRAAEGAHELGITTWALTGPTPNPLAAATDDHVAIEGPSASVQECHLIALHALCRAFDASVAHARRDRPAGRDHA